MKSANRDLWANTKQSKQGWSPGISGSSGYMTATTANKKNSASSSEMLDCNWVTLVSNGAMLVSKSCWSGCKMDSSENKKGLLKLQEDNSDCWANMKETLMVNAGNKVTFHPENLAIQDLVTNSETFQKHQIELMVKSLDLLESFHLRDQPETILRHMQVCLIAMASSMDSYSV